jgi:hypothetical protein
MRRAIFLLGGALLAAGQASAMRAHDYLDEQRGPVTLASDHFTLSINLEPPLDTAAVLAPASDEQLHASAQAAPVQLASPVPEPSGWAMLACGGLMLLLIPHKRDDSAYAIRR